MLQGPLIRFKNPIGRQRILAPATGLLVSRALLFPANRYDPSLTLLLENIKHIPRPSLLKEESPLAAIAPKLPPLNLTQVTVPELTLLSSILTSFPFPMAVAKELVLQLKLVFPTQIYVFPLRSTVGGPAARPTFTLVEAKVAPLRPIVQGLKSPTREILPPAVGTSETLLALAPTGRQLITTSSKLSPTPTPLLKSTARRTTQLMFPHLRKRARPP